MENVHTIKYKYPVSKPDLSGNELKYVTDTIKSGWISSQGSYVGRFEEAFSSWNDIEYGVACSSGTTALTIALRALNIVPGDEVITSQFSMIASAWAITYIGATPVFVDCDDTLNIDVTKIKDKITNKTKVILPIHVYGRQCDMDAIMKIAFEYNLRVVEDSCEAHGIPIKGDIACFSLFANKIITSGEGGICLTNSNHFAEQMKHLRGMAFTPEHDFLHPKLAYNFRMTNMQAAIALAQTERLDEILNKRKKIEEWYDKYLPEMVKMPKRDVLWMYDIKSYSRDDLRKFLTKNGIETRVFFKVMSQQPMYFNENYNELRAWIWSEIGLYLPTYTELNEKDIQYISKKVTDFINKDI